MCLLYNTSEHVCMFPLHLHTCICICTCTRVFMQKEESDTQAAPGLFLEWRQRKVCQATLRRLNTFISS